jgi:hypothetical protein
MVTMAHVLLFSAINRDYPFGFLPTTSVGLFRDSVPAPQFSK